MAAVWAAGPEPMMTTLLCMLRANVGDAGVAVEGLDRAAAAAKLRPEVERRERKRREENSLATGMDIYDALKRSQSAEI